MKKCFSYIRFSSKKQSAEKGGSSVYRQLEIAPRVAKANNWELDESLNVANLGLSAYSGSNLKTIRGIIKAANENRIAAGTVCILEALDRLTRINVDEAYQLLRDMLISGIEIYTDRNNRHLTKADLQNPMSIMMSVVELNSAFEYSDKLADRVMKAWRLKREKLSGGTKLTRHVPAWIDYDKWAVIPEKREIIELIFKMYLEGQGYAAISKHLNILKKPTLNGGALWSIATIAKLIKSKSVIGELVTCKSVKNENGVYKKIPTGENYKNYYPAIISEDLFYAVQAKIPKVERGIRKTETVRNLFAGVVFCTCGAKMKLNSNERGSYYICWNKFQTDGCKQPSMTYPPIETSFLEIIHDAPELFVPEKEDNFNAVNGIRSKIESLNKQISNITDATLEGNATKALIKKQGELEDEVEALEESLKIAESKHNRGNNDSKDIERVMNNLCNFSTDMELRRVVRDYCLMNFEKMVVDTKNKCYTITGKNSKTIKFQFDGKYKAFKIGTRVYQL